MAEKTNDKMSEIISLAKRRGFIYQGSEVYGGLAGTWDWGPLGVALKRNIMREWWNFWVEKSPKGGAGEIFGVDAAIVMNPRTWIASGHVATFSDPLVEDLTTHERFRADHLLKDAGIEAEGLMNEQITAKIRENSLKSPAGNELSDVRSFNMMFSTHVGAISDDEHVAYLRPETAQGIFTNYKNVVDSFYPSLPFGLAQQGKAFRNEISPRDFIFRSREFEQMEIEYFVAPETWEENFAKLLALVHEFLEQRMGLNTKFVHELEVPENDRAHYSKRTVDIEFDFPIGREELMGIAYRTDFDLSNIARESKKSMEYRAKPGTPEFEFTDEDGTERKQSPFVPHVIEPSFGVERLVMAVLSNNFVQADERRILTLPAHLAPIFATVSPLLKNKPELVEKAREVFAKLATEFPGRISWDDSGNIGKRYAKADEIGVPFCLVVDFDSLEEDDLTVRFRDSGEQVRVKISELSEFFAKN
jgi:glycyl-tRNA synthetase